MGLLPRRTNMVGPTSWTYSGICAQGGFTPGRGCMIQIFSLRMNKLLAVNQEVFYAFVDLEKAFDRVLRTKLWEILRIKKTIKRKKEEMCECEIRYVHERSHV